MARNKPVLLDEWVVETLRRMGQRHNVSMKGILESLVRALDGNERFGLVELDWGAVKGVYPSRGIIVGQRWEQVVDIVVELMSQGVRNPKEIAQRSHLTEAQVNRAISDALVKLSSRKKAGGRK
ncbi:hypothetical protein QJV44_gp47 [Serratia phage vB_SmaS_Tlacuache]|uniref:Uncharacterized protein n=1 Tax=Serratia phage vB_SmaS_Tlacuache TaxID=2894809 RepID=A0AAE8YWR8_9CAUD|nr:hypothetical protein QJV44_gp47 [Serratia phage vB_SmaS_Tlacuache]UGO51461.1 hypothetical protein TLACUACHE_47 [Serratia phage vB_SmaS_Tlacuache]